MELNVANLDALRRAVGRAPAGGSSDFDLNPEVRGLLPPGRKLRPAAVLVPIIVRGSRLAVILTKRATHLKHHPGQISFPGGKVEEGDATPLAAALREASEEIGLASDTVDIFGAIDVHETVTSFTITPFVGIVRDDFRAVPQAGEVDQVFEVPLEFLMEPANYQTHSRLWKGIPRRYYAIPYGPYYIWGATARMLKALADRMAAG